MKNFCRKVLLVCICVFSVVGMILFAACTPDKPQGEDTTYTVTVTNENGEGMQGVELRLVQSGGGKLAYVTTDAEGKATILAAEGAYDVQFKETTIPKGYGAPEGVTVSKDEPDATAKLVKKLAFKVTLLDEDGKPFYYDDVWLAICKEGGSCKSPTPLKEDGTWTYYPTAADVADNAKYEVKISLPDNIFDDFTFDGDTRNPEGSYYEGELFTYDEKNPDQSITEITITIKSAKPTSTVTLTGVGGRNVTIESADKYATVYFSPAIAGKYEISSTGNYDTRVEYYANEITMVKLGEDDDSGEGKNFKFGGDDFDIDKGVTCLFHIFVKAEAGTQFPATVGINITRLGDTANSGREYKKVTPAELGTEKYANGTGTLTYVDLSEKQTVVKGDDGYYHIGDKNGAVLVVKLKGSFRNDFGEFVFKTAGGRDIENTFLLAFADLKENISWDYTEFLEKYVGKSDDDGKCNDDGVYAVNDELKTMLERWAANCITEFTIEPLGTVAEGNEWLIPCGYYAG